MRLKRAIFLDRDGTLNFDSGYLHRIEDWRWLPGAIEGLQAFHKAGFLLVVTTNQSGIGRGYYTQSELTRLEQWVNAQLLPYGCPIDAWFHCPHLPESGCQCRKPAPGMILDAASRMNIDTSLSWMLGDKGIDVEAGLRAGCRTGLILNQQYPREQEKLARFANAIPVWQNLAEAAEEILGSAVLL